MKKNDPAASGAEQLRPNEVSIRDLMDQVARDAAAQTPPAPDNLAPIKGNDKTKGTGA